MGRKKKIKKNYFDTKEEQAVIDYANSDSKEEKDWIYNNILREPFKKMVESISKKYPIHLGNYTLEEVQMYALSHLIEQMVKYNPNKKLENGNKPKAFSYCQTIVRNYYKEHSKKSRKEILINLPYENYYSEIEKKDEYKYELDDNYDNYVDLLEIVKEEIRNVLESNNELKNDEILVGNAILNILDNWDILFLEEVSDSEYKMSTSKKFAKNKILLLLKEQTRLSTKDIRAAMEPYSHIYFFEKSKLLEE